MTVLYWAREMSPNRPNTVTGTGYNSQSSDTATTLTKSYLLNRRASPPLEITNRQAMTIFTGHVKCHPIAPTLQ